MQCVENIFLGNDSRNIRRILMTEAYGSVPVMSRYYGKVKNGVIVKYGVQIPFNFQLMSVSRTSNATEYIADIEAWMNAMPKGIEIHANWVVGYIFLNQIKIGSCSIVILIIFSWATTTVVELPPDTDHLEQIFTTF